MLNAKSDEMSIRKARREDCMEIRRLIQELADFENMPDGPKIDAKDKDHLVGYVLYFSIYSTWKGHSLFMEDLYVTPSHRHTGLGKALFAATAKEAVEGNCSRLDFSVLNWNPAQKFYSHFGAVNMSEAEGWTPHRVEGEALAALARLA